ncbi:hypothetical protein [Streptomyces chattanoogensis]|uniref:Uncharacterized protein n=1 Tax=Streptomyces chattanoogensis TaxID=66876 RepID=A0A0N1JWZ4_9ACTN|nr:hypothetical protein [Streptomyces chattanoogensis]AJT63375.1 hypothetical protein T261_1690 [Streptomyces lydicus]KPC60483.1 hypothetical protein ADL29_29160 [Streptomyces chattanoogensis]
MKTLRRAFVASVLTLALGGLMAPAASAAPSGAADVRATPVSAALSCRAADNHGEIAAKFISRCKKGSIRREFPTDRLSRSLGQIYDGKLRGDRDDVKAWKLLNDRRFDK